MPSAAAVRFAIESALERRIPAALSPAPKLTRPMAQTGIAELDALLQGGLPLGAVSELVGAECSGRTTVALSFLARMTQAAKICAWIDVSNAFDPGSAASMGTDLRKVLWVRCGVGPSAPRTLTSADTARQTPGMQTGKPWQSIDQALRATDLLLQSSGFGAIVIDLAGLPRDVVTRIPLATWHRYRVAAEKSQSSVVVLAQHACAQSSAALSVRLQPVQAIAAETTVLSGIQHRAELVRKRFADDGPGAASFKKPAQQVTSAGWQSSTAWTCRR